MLPVPYAAFFKLPDKSCNKINVCLLRRKCGISVSVYICWASDIKKCKTFTSQMVYLNISGKQYFADIFCVCVVSNIFYYIKRTDSLQLIEYDLGNK